MKAIHFKKRRNKKLAKIKLSDQSLSMILARQKELLASRKDNTKTYQKHMLETRIIKRISIYNKTIRIKKKKFLHF